MTLQNLLQSLEMALTSFTHHDEDYADYDWSNNSFLDYCQQEDNFYEQVDSSNFLHDTDTFTPIDIPQDFDDEYYSYIDNNYIEFDDGFSLTHMRKLTDKDITNHIKKINNDVTHVNFDKIYSYQRRQMVVHQFKKIFQGILDVDPSCTLSRYIELDSYIDRYCPNSLDHKDIESITMTADPYIDIWTLQLMLRDRLVFSLTAKGLKYLQNLWEFQYTCKDAAEYKINTTEFTMPHKIHDKNLIDQIQIITKICMPFIVVL